MGLHLPVPSSLLQDPYLKEHRLRVWWTAYIFDRMWAAKLGYPTGISDTEIEIGLPSDFSSDPGGDEFADSAYLIARVGLAKLCGRLVSSVYGRKVQQNAFLYHRVQEAFGELRTWMDDLPASLNINTTPNNSRAESLQLLFNQLAILVTRPILLHVLRTQHQAHKDNDSIPESATALSEACILYARHTSRLLIDSWTNGSFMIFDYSYTQYMFAAATILVISNLLRDKGHESDLGHFRCLSAFLTQLKRNGNFAAAEFCTHVDAIEQLLSVHAPPQINDLANPTATNLGFPMELDVNTFSADYSGYADSSTNPYRPAASALFPHDPLTQPLSELQFIDESIFTSDMGLYWHHDLSEPV